MTDLTQLSASDISLGVRARDFSAKEVTEAVIARHAAQNPAINAIVEPTHEAAFEAARAIDVAVAEGRALGRLAGVPVTTKVNVDQAGLATTNGLRLQADLVAHSDSPFITNLRAAGAIIVGRTNTPAFSLRWFTNNSLYGQTLNPRNPALTPGGSSGGAAAAVAAGLCTIGHGTDIAGSIRYPAYACGVHGLRPTLGRVPIFNASSGDRYIGAQLMAVSGPIARTMDDLELGYSVMAGLSAHDPWSVPQQMDLPDYPKCAALALAPDGMQTLPEVVAALEAAAAALRDAGWKIVEMPTPPLREAAEINAVLWMAETRFAADEAMRNEADPDALFVYDQMCRDVGEVDLERVMTALRRRATLMREWDLFLQEHPLLICPVSAELPFAQQLDVQSDASFARVYASQLTQRGLPVMGMPSMSVATGVVRNNPVGVQLVAGRYREDVLFAAGRQLEAAFGKPVSSAPAEQT